MVRLKTRYLLFEIVSTDNNSSNVISLHRAFPSNINGKLIMQLIKDSIQLNFGDYGSGKVNSLLQLKYWSNNTGSGIIRCHREDIDLLIASIALINGNDKDFNGCLVVPVKTSGTMKKLEQYMIYRNKKILSLVDDEKIGD